MRPQSLRTRIQWTVIGASLGLLSLVSADIASIALPRFRDLDRMFVERDQDHVTRLLIQQMASQARVCRDWGVWESMDGWIRDPSHGPFWKENLQTTNIKGAGLSRVVLYDLTGARRLDQALTIRTGFLDRWLDSTARAWAGHPDTASRSGATLVAGRMWSICVQPIRATDSSRAASGLLVAAEPLSIGSLAENGFNVVLDGESTEESTDSMVIDVELAGWSGLHPGRLQLRHGRDVWKEGAWTILLMMAGVILFGFAFGFIITRVLDRVVIRRLEFLREDLGLIKDNPGGRSRVRDLGADDLGRVASEINASLDSLEESKRYLADAQRIARLGFWELELETMTAKLSAEHVETAGLDREVREFEVPFEEYLGRWVHPEDREKLKAWAVFASSRVAEDLDRDLEYRTIGADGGVRHLSAACRKKSGEGSVLFLVAQDVTERRKMEEELLRGSLYDPLTGLPNRNLVMDRLEKALSGSGSEAVSFIALDFDRFHAINASMGCDVGDGMLLGLAVRLVGAVPPGTTVGRFAHSEFGIVLEGMHQDAIERIAETLRAVARTPLPLGGRELVLTGSVGVASDIPGGCKAEALVSRAESAALQASARGGDTVVYFDAERSRQAKERVDLEIDLARAIPGQLELHYQPIVNLTDGRVAGFEALVRWRHPTRGMISPLQFIPIAERTGLIQELGLWVMGEALMRLSGWQKSFGQRSPFMSINLSVKQFHQADLAEQIERKLQQTGAQAHGIKLEITESALSEDPERVASILERLVAQGVRFSLDDFGTGYSSLGYLSRFPVQTLKVDKSFVDELGRDERKSRITSAIVTLAHSLRMDVVAEGIETSLQRDRLRALGCEYGQGYLFAKPLPFKQAEDYLYASMFGNPSSAPESSAA
ncbi:MAG: EAL domain-containing protein [Fibrobacteres bacterium]|nr:EAL domain-containing protein [Fibrobacterota bacterium]